MTVGGRSCAEVDGFVQLLDQKVLDPRLMSKLLRFQAALLVRYAFTQPLSVFRFEAGTAPQGLHRKLPLDISLLALLVEGAIYSADQTASEDNCAYVRRAIRGQNLDRAGLSARHMKILNVLSDPKAVAELIHILGWEQDEVTQVLSGFEMAELVERRKQAVAGQFIVYEPDATQAQILRDTLEDSDHRYSGKVVRDKLALQLVLKRLIPNTLVFASDNPAACNLIGKLLATKDPRLAKMRVLAISGDNQAANWHEGLGFRIDATVPRPCTADKLFTEMDRILNGDNVPTRVFAAEQLEQSELATAGTQS
jgi:DNA-binding MarR family transcriptional regulator